jgi:3-phytase
MNNAAKVSRANFGLASLVGLLLLLASCQSTQSDAFQPASVYATVETVPVDAQTDADAADDPAVWFNPANPAESRVLGSDKKRGLEVFRLDGSRVTTDPIGRINNIDLRDGFVLGGQRVALVGGSHRDAVGMVFWTVNEAGLQRVRKTAVKSKLEDVYGFCLYRFGDRYYAFVNSKTGAIEQWELFAAGDSVDAKCVRTLKLGSQVEGMVADDAAGVLFVGVEDEGIYSFDARPEGSLESKLLAESTADNPAIAYDVEGLALFAPNDSTGYLVASSQGNRSYALFDRSAPHAYVGSFTVEEGTVDGTYETDGIEVSAHAFPGFPDGLFVAQDGANTDGHAARPQNFKLVSWEEIAKALNLPNAKAN